MSTRTGVLLLVVLFLPLGEARLARADELSDLDRSIADHPKDARGYETYAVAAMSAGRLDDAISRLRVGVARVPAFGRGYYLLAVAHRHKGEWADAASAFRTCINLRAQENDARFGLAKALLGLGDRTGAIDALRRYIKDERDPAKARFVEAARADLARLEGVGGVGGEVAAAPVAPTELRERADLLKAAGKLEEAAVAYRGAIEAAPRDAPLHNELGTVLFALKRYAEAAEAFAAATERDGSYAVAWFNLASALRRVPRPLEAVRAGQRYVELLPADPDGWYALGQALELGGDTAGSIDAYRRFLAIESRPAQQKYVDKARAQLEALEERQRAGAMGLKPIERDEVLPPAARASPQLADLRDPFDAGAGSSGPPIPAAGTLDPFAASVPAAEPEAPAGRTREYLAALAAYRRALSAHVERVSARYEKGAALALAGKLREASAAWDTVPLDDSQLLAARRQLESLRARR